jgi:peptide deformylase
MVLIMKLPLAYYGNPILRRKAAPIENLNEEIHQLIINMEETMDANNGCGLAAPQIHQSLSLFITKIPRYENNQETTPGILRVFMNPKIVAYSPEEWACPEACLSIPGLRENVSRPLRVTIQAMDLNGQIFVEEFIGFDAHVMMHENDHLNGVLYIDRISARRKKEIEKQLREIKKKYQ